MRAAVATLVCGWEVLSGLNAFSVLVSFIIVLKQPKWYFTVTMSKVTKVKFQAEALLGSL